MTDSIAALTAQIVGAYAEANKLAADDLPKLIASVAQALQDKPVEGVPEALAAVKKSKAQIAKSITPEALISFEDGRPYTMLKRHLRTLGLTPEEYRAKWGLPLDYPMTAASYSARRSEFAKGIGLGQRVRRS